MSKEKNTIKDKLTTDYYKVLEILYANQTTIRDKTLVPLTQNEVADMLGVHKMTVNAIFKELKADGLVIQAEGKKRTYFLTDEATDICKRIMRIKC
jgi:Mn-dependent DtxR family transcriptional regulator